MNMEQAKVLQLNIAGQPQCWLTLERAATMTYSGQVAWTASPHEFVLTGGTSRATGELSTIAINSIIAVRGEINKFNSSNRIILTNKTLFARDKNVCAYCGNVFNKASLLSRDHVVPKSKGGQDIWTNVVTSCIPCNQKKANNMIDGNKLKLLYIPYRPCHSESLLLSNRNVLADQQKFLMQSIKKSKAMH